VAGWNSLTHVMLITSVEKSFGIRFDLLEMIEMKSLGDIAWATHDKVK
jgi:acyl carrier protein